MCPFHCELAVNMHGNNHTLAGVHIATCILPRPTPALNNDEVILIKSLSVKIILYVVFKM